jgi:hypothetical protein
MLMSFRLMRHVFACVHSPLIVCNLLVTAALRLRFLSHAVPRSHQLARALSLCPTRIRPHVTCLANCRRSSSAGPSFRRYQYVEAPLFVLENRFDENQIDEIMGLKWWPFKNETTGERYKEYFGQLMLDGVQQVCVWRGSGSGSALEV